MSEKREPTDQEVRRMYAAALAMIASQAEEITKLRAALATHLEQCPQAHDAILKAAQK